MKYKKGFTLIELLVTVTLVTFLISLVAVGMHSLRLAQRDAYRIGVLKEYAKALDAYYSNNGHYPFNKNSLWSASCWVGPSGNWISDNGNYNWSNGYILNQPHDPVESCIWPFKANDNIPTGSFGYFSDGTNYMLVALFEGYSNPSDIAHNPQNWLYGNTDLYTQAGWYGRTLVLKSKTR